MILAENKSRYSLVSFFLPFFRQFYAYTPSRTPHRLLWSLSAVVQFTPYSATRLECTRVANSPRLFLSSKIVRLGGGVVEGVMNGEVGRGRQCQQIHTGAIIISLFSPSFQLIFIYYLRSRSVAVL